MFTFSGLSPCVALCNAFIRAASSVILRFEEEAFNVSMSSGVDECEFTTRNFIIKVEAPVQPL